MILKVVKNKIKNQRTVFHREHRKLERRTKRKKWFAYDLLGFLMDVEKSTAHSSDNERQSGRAILDEVCVPFFN